MTEMLLKYFREQQKQAETERIYNTQCPYCSMQCKMQLVEQTHVKRKRIKQLEETTLLLKEDYVSKE